ADDGRADRAVVRRLRLTGDQAVGVLGALILIALEHLERLVAARHDAHRGGELLHRTAREPQRSGGPHGNWRSSPSPSILTAAAESPACCSPYSDSGDGGLRQVPGSS